MRFLLNATLSAFLLLVSFACNTRLEKSSEPSEGMPGEVFIVSDENEVSDIKSAFESHYTVFDSILLIAEKADEHKFEKNYAFWYGRSESYEGIEKKASLIVVFGDAGKYSKDLTKTHPTESMSSDQGFSIDVFKDIWAKPQTVFRLRYGRDMNAIKILQNGGAKLIGNLIKKHELGQGLPGNIAADKFTDSIRRMIENNYGFGFKFPPQLKLAYSNTDVVWLQQETQQFYRHIFVNIFSDSLPIESKDQAIENRNYYSKKYIKNSEGTSTLVSESSLFPISFEKDIQVGNHTAHVLKGWYHEDGTFRRGPFVRYYFHDKTNRRYIALDGFVYAPEINRLGFYRLFEIIGPTFYLK